jgi:hypothetical protein
MAAVIESLTEKISINSLAEEVKYTNKLSKWYMIPQGSQYNEQMTD